jgi:hypothetical protein
MSPRRNASSDIVASLRDRAEVERYTAACRVLRTHIVHRRDIPGGKDFLFSGPPDALHDALRVVVAAEHRANRLLQTDFAQIDEYFLLRMTGGEDSQAVIAGYFTPDEDL